MLSRTSTYEELYGGFRWQIPEFYNIGVDACDKWAEREPHKLALISVDERGSGRNYGFGELRRRSNQLANLLSGRGITRGDRVGILVPQAPETAYSHIAVYKLGAISVPLFRLFGVEALLHRLADSGARAIITDAEGLAKIDQLKPDLPQLEIIICIDGSDRKRRDFSDRLNESSELFDPVKTRADDPAILIYTSGTTGAPKGALHAHRVLLGHLPGVEMSHDFFPQPGDRIWTPADWAWIGGLLDVLFPALHHGVPVVAYSSPKFSAEAAFELIQNYEITNTFLPPTALKMMRAVSEPGRRWKLNLRTIASGGESLGSELVEWGRRTFGVTINEFYGQTECNMVLSSSAALMEPRPGVIGQPVPGHRVNVIDTSGKPCADGELGSIAIQRPDPVMFISYWNNPQATETKFRGDWLLTGDNGVREPGGWIRFVGRNDDVITSAGYRIGPGEIEDCLIRHPAVKLACVVGKPDPERTEIVKAYVVLGEGYTPSLELAADIAEHVRSRLAAHEYPREVEFVTSLPITSTGKLIRRELRKRAEEEVGQTATLRL